MAQWEKVKSLPPQSLSELYPTEFPMEVRYYLASWIEEQPWEEFNVDDPSQEAQALQLLEQIISFLQGIAQQNANVVERLRLQHIGAKMSEFQSQPLLLVKTVQNILRKERDLLSQMSITFHQNPPQQPCPPAPSPLGAASPGREDRSQALAMWIMKVTKIREESHLLKGEMLRIQESELPEQVKKTQIQQMEFNGQALSLKRFQLLQEAVHSLNQCQIHHLHKIQTWRRDQHLATIGGAFSEDLGPLQTWCEHLLGANMKLREEVLLAGRDCGGTETIQECQKRLDLLLQTLIQSSLIVDKQPPQVVKTHSKFSTSVRLLLGEKMAPGRPVHLKAQIVTEVQARNLVQMGAMPAENVGELVSNTAIMEHNASNKSTCAIFRNMCIKKIKRADRRGSESVTEEKFAIHFSGDVVLMGCELPCKVQTLSFPIVVIVHGSQDINAMATIIWDCAFSDFDRVPFVVPDRVPWKQMCMTLDNKFMSEVQTQRGLDAYNHHFLAQKIFNKPEYKENFSNMLVSWSQFNKEMLSGRTFTFWQWFDGVMELSKKHLRYYWSDGLISGFIGKQHLHVILQDRPNGTFLLRFSDSEIGGITIAYVAQTENGGRRVQNIQPFSKKDLEIRCLGDRIRDIEAITHLYPNFPKNEVFQKYYTDEQRMEGRGYIGVSIRTKVEDTTAHPPLDPQQEITLAPSLSPYPPDNVYPPEAPPPQPDPSIFYPGQQPPYQNDTGGAFVPYSGPFTDPEGNSIFSTTNTTPSPGPSLHDMDLEFPMLDPDMYGVPPVTMTTIGSPLDQTKTNSASKF
ncbi:signal transducer and activator of transcription 6 isoform X2 [Paramormyrops kingsleyae]|uniref:signal transducer and activator of transcription 6 isoform X2 n=1 Tax=Paramormyrops kingsleyae TaxID=1676925 RepID=UPI000CD5CFF5|nr:signal transducer and activator of transcription 6 isoform X2 [Paramormyrops kingsleyae]